MHQPSEYQPPDDIWEVNRRLRVDEPLDGENDPRWVDTGAARGEYSHHRLYRMLGVNPDGAALRLGTPPERSYYLFCGHRGCGKSTELRRVRNDLHSPTLYYVVFADAAQELDVNNLRYQDILLHLASKLVEQLNGDDIGIERVHLRRIEDWFTQRVERQEETSQFALEIKAGAGVETGLPFIGKVFARISDTFKTNSTYKTELRRTLQNYFTDFADAFNHLIEAAEDAVRAAGMGRRILFVIDGTDLLRDEDARAFFIADVHQLQQVRGLFIYCAPIHLVYEGTSIEQSFDRIFNLPMIKVANADGSRNEIGFNAMREMLYRRAAPNLFDDGVVDDLIEQSGGHPARLPATAAKRVHVRREESFRPRLRTAGGARPGQRVPTLPRYRGLSDSGDDRFESGEAHSLRPNPLPALQPGFAGVQRLLLAQPSSDPHDRCLSHRPSCARQRR